MNLEAMISALTKLRPYTRIRARLHPSSTQGVHTKMYNALRSSVHERIIEVTAYDLDRLTFTSGMTKREIDITVLPSLRHAGSLVDLALAIDSFEILA